MANTRDRPRAKDSRAAGRLLGGRSGHGIVRITDRSKDARGRAFLVEERLSSMAELDAIVADYTALANELGYAPMGWY